MNHANFRAKLGVLRRRAGILTRRPRLGVHVWLSDNPYSDILYRQFRGSCAPQPMTLLEELETFTRLPSDKRLLWIHSEASYSWGRSGRHLEEAHHSYLSSLERWSRKDGRLVWTIHDDGLHLNDSNLARIQTIRDKLLEMVDCVHVHSNTAKALVLRSLGVDSARVIVVPHPSYAPLYSEATDQWEQEEKGDRVAPRELLCFGHVKAYKDYGALASALEQLGGGSFARLTIAGKLGDDMALPEEIYRKNLELDLRLRFIPDEEVPRLFARAHFLVLPYTESLTSGAAALSMGFGVPVIAPDLGGMREAVPEENWPLIYDLEEPDGLACALRRARDMSSVDYQALANRCRAFGEAIHPDRISAELVRILTERGLLVP
jgi:beta-1,4-mannosyltransferase